MAFVEKESSSLEAVTALQQIASDPDYSVWVSASAGSGKTKVLTDRVLRLLLKGAEPSKILCLTFTKAAASEMRMRIQSILMRWSVSEKNDLKIELKALMGRSPNDEELALASHLFSFVMDASPALRIQTIHAFCQKILKQFPLEANLSPHFEAIDEGASRQLLEESYGAFLERLASSEEKALKDALASFVGRVAEETLRDLLFKALQDKERFLALQTLTSEEEAYKKLMGLDGDAPNHFWQESEAQNLLHRFKEAAYKGSAKDQEKATFLEVFLREEKEVQLEKYEAFFLLFLSQKGTIRKNLLTKKALAYDEGLQGQLENFADKIFHLNQALKSFALLKMSRDFMKLARALLAIFEEKKRARSALDYDDLILRTAALLRHSNMADWVLYKLDYGIDHILVDEAQDTNAQQWEIITALAEEFFSGQGAREENRTLFVVGDEKQSIYRFQGAHPELFVRLKDYFALLVKGAGKIWKFVRLNLSFRSTDAILNLVDKVFEAPLLKEGVLGVDVMHEAHRAAAWGRVELWPVVKDESAQKLENMSAWENASQRQSHYTAHYRLALSIAETIQNWLQSGKYLPSKGRAIQPKDIMLLLRKRDHFFHLLIRTLKQHHIPISGADRMVLGEQLVIEDLICLGQWLLLPEDDLMLASLLRSPLIGLSEEALFTLAHARKSTLWSALKIEASKQPNSFFEKVYGYLKDLLGRVDLISVYELYHYVLTLPCPQSEISGYDAFTRRLGGDIEDPIESFLNLLSAHEKKEGRSLQIFIQSFLDEQIEIKKEMASEHNAVQIMTIHGSKGLQAPIVIIPDSVTMPKRLPLFYWHGEAEMGRALPFLLMGEGAEAPFAAQLKDEERARQREEYYRLLYVALTRAEDELYIGGVLPRSEEAVHADSWYKALYDAMEALGDEHHFTFGKNLERGFEGRGFIYETGYPLGEPSQEKEDKSPAMLELPDWLFKKIRAEKPSLSLMNPSNALVEKEKALSPLTYGKDVWRFKRGNLIHKLLQILPELSPLEREAAGRAYLSRPSHGLSDSQIEYWLKEALAILNHSEFKEVFSPQSRAEVPLVGIVDGQKISAQIDRLLVGEKKVFFIDYKTARPSPSNLRDVPDYYIEQMELYRALLQKRYPNKRIRGALIWTETPCLMELF